MNNLSLSDLILIINIALAGTLFYGLVKVVLMTKSLKRQELNLVEKAKKKADGVIEGAIEKSGEILEETEYFKNSLIDQANKTLEDSAKENIKEFDKQLDTLSTEAVDQMKQNLNSLEEVTKKKVEEAMVKVEAEIEQHKQNKLASIDTAVAEKVSALGLKLLGKSISLDDHDELVVKALEEAKKEGVL